MTLELSKIILKAGPTATRYAVRRAIEFKTSLIYSKNGKPKKISYKRLMAPKA
jgi:hypothetical protein